MLRNKYFEKMKSKRFVFIIILVQIETKQIYFLLFLKLFIQKNVNYFHHTHTTVFLKILKFRALMDLNINNHIESLIRGFFILP